MLLAKIFNVVAFYLDLARQKSKQYTSQIKNQEFQQVINKISEFESQIKKDYSPLTIILSFLLLLIAYKLFNFIFRKFLKLVFKSCCGKKSYSAATLKSKKESEQLIESYINNNIKCNKMKPLEFSNQKANVEELCKRMSRLMENERKAYTGENKISGTLYYDDNDLNTLCSKACEYYSYANVLHPDVYPSARHIEAELIKINVNIFSGNETEMCGCLTYGETESSILTLLAYRTIAEERGIKVAEVITSAATFARYYKVCDMLNIKLRIADIDEQGRVIVSHVSDLINSNTIAIIGLFPNVAYGTLDDIEGLSKLAISRNLFLHVDATYGGYLAAFSDNSGSQIVPRFDFFIPGVSTIQTDCYRYGLSPSGISVLLYRNREIRRKHFFIFTKWMGGFYLTPSLPGSKTSFFSVAAYMNFLHYGKDKFREQYRKINQVVNNIKNYVKDKMPKIKIIGDPQLSIFSIRGEHVVKIYRLLREKKWKLNLNLSCNTLYSDRNKSRRGTILNEDSINFCITMANIETVNNLFIKDLEEAYNLIEKHPNVEEDDEIKMLRTTASLPLELQKENLAKLIDAYLDPIN